MENRLNEQMVVNLPDRESAKIISKILENFYCEPPKAIGGLSVEKIFACNSESDEKFEVANGEIARGIYFELSNECWCSVSATDEGKMLFKFSSCGETYEKSLYNMELIKRGIFHAVKC